MSSTTRYIPDVDSMRRLWTKIDGLRREPTLAELRALLEAARGYCRRWKEDPGEYLACMMPFGIPAESMAYIILCDQLPRKLELATQAWRGAPGRMSDGRRRRIMKAGARLERICRQKLQLTDQELDALKKRAIDDQNRPSSWHARRLLGSYYEWLLPELELEATTTYEY